MTPRSAALDRASSLRALDGEAHGYDPLSSIEI
jgi:hypothetical protein